MSKTAEKKARNVACTPERQEKGKKINSDTPRREARKRALEYAKDLETAKKRSVVVGRQSWPADERG